jgi:hypothetical protein
MTRDASITIDWADGTYVFRLAWGQLMELQDQCDAGPYVVLNRMASGSWKMQDITHTIRLGLIGGGLAPPKALGLVRQYVEARPPMENWAAAYAILSAGIIGHAEDEPKKKAGKRPSGSMTSQTESSDLPKSSEPVQPSV